MAELNFDLMSNSELKVKMIEYKNEYEAIKSIISESLNRMEELDRLYNNAQNVLAKRNCL